MSNTCLYCGNQFHVWPYSIRNGNGLYCNRTCYAGSQKGKPNGRKGMSNPKLKGANNPMFRHEVREKHKAKIRRGENHPSWKGGVTPIYKTIRKSPEYKAWRTAVFERDNYTCQDCGLKPGLGKRVDLHADHIKPFAMYPELRFDVGNGKTLCVPCHKKTPTYGGKTITLIKQGVTI